MTVAELIDALTAFDPHLVVWHDGGGDPYCAGPVTSLQVVRSEGRTLMGHEGSTPTEWLELS